MAKSTKKKEQEFLQIYGINGASNIVGAKKVNIIRIDLMVFVQKSLDFEWI